MSIFRTAADWLKVVPWGMRRVLNWVKDQYNNPDVYITENGRPQEQGHADSLHDSYRTEYVKLYTNEVLKGIVFLDRLKRLISVGMIYEIQ